ncbi:hypothetical protein A0H81_06928 [Grifola frondosa]|uniref:Uncharacterized protein n=1 Tax=Grifola frondosa TaxID=5627 RepID=A0A1C7M956_GRIFR|nr:hypothetical protein A0H81_06928 [Grifola frondosa]
MASARPSRERPDGVRGSVLRASILESALELGVTTNCTVANWIFNPVQEGDEDAELENTLSPSLTYASTATSEESSLSASPSQHLQPGAGVLHFGKPVIGVDTSLIYSRDTSRADHAGTAVVLTSSPSKKSKKLRKARPDGYDSDGGYMSDSGKGKKDKNKKSKKKGKADDAEYESDGGYLSETSGKKKKEKKSKKEKKGVDSPSTDYDTDGGKSVKSRKVFVTSPATGDDSDGGYLSEASTKKRGFFRLNSRSRKKKGSVELPIEAPPVPALPSMPLPIAERFIRSDSPSPSDLSGTTTTMLSEVRPSVETFTSVDTDSRITSISSVEGLTRAFRDAESVRSPSIDFLSAFRRPGAVPTSPSKLGSYHYEQPYDNPISSPRSSLVPALSPAKSVRSRPKISAPNTSALSTKHVPVPLTLTPPTPTRMRAPHAFPSPEPDYVLDNEKAGDDLIPLASPVPPSPTGSQTLVRPHVLAYYDLPPPSPPPSGPLPDVPSDVSRSTSPALSMLHSSRFPRSAPADSRAPSRPIPSTPMERPSTAGPTPARARGTTDVPLLAQPIPPIQRGRQSPFPVMPLLPREEAIELVRRTSRRGLAGMTRPPASANPYRSAQYEQLGVHWQPRSASALERRRPDGLEAERSVRWEDEDTDIEEVVATYRDVYDGSVPGSDVDDDRTDAGGSHETAQSAESEEGGNRATMYSVADTEGESHYSAWSANNSRVSILDEERSAAAREKFVRRVEAMYGKDVIPPVPPLNHVVRAGSL